jgi:hypothetical protein
VEQLSNEKPTDSAYPQTDADAKAKAAAEEAENKRISKTALDALAKFPELRKKTLGIWWRVAPAYHRAKQQALAVAGGKMRARMTRRSATICAGMGSTVFTRGRERLW